MRYLHPLHLLPIGHEWGNFVMWQDSDTEGDWDKIERVCIKTPGEGTR